jgi:hypothetical protein
MALFGKRAGAAVVEKPKTTKQTTKQTTTKGKSTTPKEL